MAIKNRSYVSEIPDLIQPEEYPDHPDGNLYRFRIEVGEDGVEITGDGFRPVALEQILRLVADAPVEQMLCG